MKILALLTFENSLVFAYMGIGLLSLLAYLPQIRKLFKSKNGASDISIETWSVWSLDAVISLLYAIFILKDIPASLIFGIDFLGALTILTLAASNKVRHGSYTIRSARIAAVCTLFSQAAVRQKP